MTQKHLLLVLAVVLSSCEFKCSIGKDANTPSSKDSTNATTKPTSTDQSTKEKPSTRVLNDIDIQGVNVTVNQAYLSFDDGSLVPSDNKIALDQTVILNINADGWKDLGGKSFLGVTQVVTASDGEHVLDSQDLFAKYDETGINADDAKVLRLKASIAHTKPGIEYFLVTFHVWDKKGDGEIKVSYKFYIK